MNKLMGGNSEQDALTEMKWSYAADGIQLMLKADAALNRYDNLPHTLMLKVIQMKESTPFSSLLTSPQAIEDFLSADTLPTGLLAVDRLFLEPGDKRSITLPRVENARYIGIIAGYYHLDAARGARLFGIGVSMTSSGIIAQTRQATPEPLLISLDFGPDSLIDSTSHKAPPMSPVKPVSGPLPINTKASNP